MRPAVLAIVVGLFVGVVFLRAVARADAPPPAPPPDTYTCPAGCKKVYACPSAAYMTTTCVWDCDCDANLTLTGCSVVAPGR